MIVFIFFFISLFSSTSGYCYCNTNDISDTIGGNDTIPGLLGYGCNKDCLTYQNVGDEDCWPVCRPGLAPTGYVNCLQGMQEWQLQSITPFNCTVCPPGYCCTLPPYDAAGFNGLDAPCSSYSSRHNSDVRFVDGLQCFPNCAINTDFNQKPTGYWRCENGEWVAHGNMTCIPVPPVAASVLLVAFTPSPSLYNSDGTLKSTTLAPDCVESGFFSVSPIRQVNTGPLTQKVVDASHRDTWPFTNITYSPVDINQFTLPDYPYFNFTAMQHFTYAIFEITPKPGVIVSLVEMIWKGVIRGNTTNFVRTDFMGSLLFNSSSTGYLYNQLEVYNAPIDQQQNFPVNLYFGTDWVPRESFTETFQIIMVFYTFNPRYANLLSFDLLGSDYSQYDAGFTISGSVIVNGAIPTSQSSYLCNDLSNCGNSGCQPSSTADGSGNGNGNSGDSGNNGGNNNGGGNGATTNDNTTAIVAASSAGAAVVFLVCICCLVCRIRSRNKKLKAERKKLELVVRSHEHLMEIPVSELKFVKVVGEGFSGVVFKATWRGTEVAVKQMKSGRVDNLADFENEERIAQRLARHPRVVPFLGWYINPTLREARYASPTSAKANANTPLPFTLPSTPTNAPRGGETDCLIVMNFMPFGSMEDVLITRQEYAFNNSPRYNDDVKMQYLRDLTQMCLDAAAGVLHCHSQGVIHRDIAARNFLVDQFHRVTVADFGMSASLSEGEKKGYAPKDHPMPIAWCAPESIADGEYSRMSDVYMFGVFLNEVMTRTNPYPGRKLAEVANEVINHSLRPHLADWCPQEWAHLIESCWRSNPTARPTMEQITAVLSSYLDRLSAAANLTDVYQPLRVPGSGPIEYPAPNMEQQAAAYDRYEPAQRVASAGAGAGAGYNSPGDLMIVVPPQQIRIPTTYEN